MRQTFFLTLLLVECFAFQLSAQTQPDSTAKKSPAVPIQWSYKIIDAPGNTFGYDIYADTDRLIIHQPSLPGRHGDSGFKTKEQAEKMAQLAVSKLKKGIMPPSISEEELKSVLE